MGYEKSDPARYPNARTRPDSKPEKSLAAHALIVEYMIDKDSFQSRIRHCAMLHHCRRQKQHYPLGHAGSTRRMIGGASSSRNHEKRSHQE